MLNSVSLSRKYKAREDIRAAVILLALLVICFWPFVFGNKTLLESAREAPSIMPYGAWTGETVPTAFARTKDPGAPAWDSEPLLQLTRQEYLKEKTLPFWNPYQAFGTPLAANMQSQVFDPVTLAVSLVHTPRTVNWYLLFRLFVSGICAFLYMRLFVSFIPALASGITSMFSGYYLLYITMPHLSVEVFLPAILLSSEYLIRAPKFRTLAWFAVVVFFVLVGGMPESSFLLLALSYIYMLFRAVTEPSLRSDLWRRIGFVLSATVSGFCFSAVLLLPFRQYMRHSFDTHQFANTGSLTGLIYDQPVSTFFSYFFPFMLGSGWDNNLRNYTGLISLFLFVVSVLCLSWRRENGNQTLSWLTCFFGALAVGIVLKRYGFSLVNGIGSLPLFNLVLYVKYQEPLLSFALSVLSAIGLERLAKYPMTAWKLIVAVLISFLMIPAALFSSAEPVAKLILANKLSSQITVWAILLPCGLLTVLSLLLLFTNMQRISEKFSDSSLRSYLSQSVLLILTCETLFSYFIPTYYVWNQLPTVTSNPYAGAPFINPLKAMAGNYRIFAEDNVLFPDWAAAFGLFDIRSLDAMYYRKYLPFVQQFFPLMPHQPGDELYDRFTGSSGYKFDGPLQRRLLQLSSVKYVVTMPATLLENNTIVDEILAQNSGRLTPGHQTQISRQTLAVGGITRVALGEHPPYDRLPYSVKVEKGREILHFSYGINPAAFAACGDGVEFIVEAKDAAGSVSKLFASFIDPRHDMNLRRWVDGTVDLSRYLGQDIDVLLTTNGGPKGDICADWAVWSDFHFDGPLTATSFRRVYDKEVGVYEYNRVLPRAALFFNATLKPTEDQVLKYLADPSFNVFQTVLINSAALDKNQAVWMNELNNSPGKPVQAAAITSYKSQEVMVQASLDRRGILVLNDTDYPGWDVYVDGVPAKVISANYMFRGVALEPGDHRIRFVYMPSSVRLGTSISLASVSFFALFGISRIITRRRTPVALLDS